ncbi:MAG: hypothetical protein OQL16_03265 [Gammaproteobacteria bacterium]|nr:hypothetical protein [Gammaproteobacteria bacterium]
MRIIGLSGLILISIVALWAHADRLPNPPGPAYSGFMPGDWQYKNTPDETSGCE